MGVRSSCRMVFSLSLLILSFAALTTLPLTNAQTLTWATVTSPTNKQLSSASCVSSGDCWAVGSSGVIIQWTGSSWATITSPDYFDLYSMFCVSSGNCWAVGVMGKIIQVSGSSWVSVTSPTGNDLSSVSCASSSACWAVGESGTTIQGT